jgi:hypothetical protein
MGFSASSALLWIFIGKPVYTQNWQRHFPQAGHDTGRGLVSKVAIQTVSIVILRGYPSDYCSKQLRLSARRAGSQS